MSPGYTRCSENFSCVLNFCLGDGSGCLVETAIPWATWPPQLSGLQGKLHCSAFGWKASETLRLPWAPALDRATSRTGWGEPCLEDSGTICCRWGHQGKRLHQVTFPISVSAESHPLRHQEGEGTWVTVKMSHRGKDSQGNFRHSGERRQEAIHLESRNLAVIPEGTGGQEDSAGRWACSQTSGFFGLLWLRLTDPMLTVPWVIRRAIPSQGWWCTCVIPELREAEAGRLQVGVPFGKFSETLTQNKKLKKGKRGSLGIEPLCVWALLL